METSALERTGGRSLLISFVVIAYNEEHHIGHCLEAIEAQEGLAKHEVIVWTMGRQTPLPISYVRCRSGMTRCV